MKLFWAILLVSLTFATAQSSDQKDVRFTQSATNSSKRETQRRLGYEGPAAAYNVAGETFRVIVPEAYTANSGWGALVWISPSDDAWIPSEWKPELEKHRLLFVGANKTGNKRDVLDRARLAVDAAGNVLAQYAIDRKRVYVAGFSGGGRMASILGVSYADTFAGTLCICGVDFYQLLPANNGTYYPMSYFPGARNLAQAKKAGRFVLLTGEKDVNRENTKDVLEKGFRPNGFRNVLYLEVPGMGHAVPGAAYFKTALDYLAGTNNSGALPDSH